MILTELSSDAAAALAATSRARSCASVSVTVLLLLVVLLVLGSATTAQRCWLLPAEPANSPEPADTNTAGLTGAEPRTTSAL
jgi:hypothetical protein